MYSKSAMSLYLGIVAAFATSMVLSSSRPEVGILSRRVELQPVT